MHPQRLLKNSFRLAAALLACASPSFGSILASATYTATQSTPGVYNYSLTLNNTGTTNIGTFWFSWVPGAGFLSPVPVAGSISSPTGWTFTATNAGAAIRWVTTGSLLPAGSSLSGFNFASTETPAQLASLLTVGAFTDPGTVFYVYEGAPLVGTPFTANATAAAPEPGSLLLTFTGLSGGLALLKRKWLAQVVSGAA